MKHADHDFCHCPGDLTAIFSHFVSVCLQFSNIPHYRLCVCCIALVVLCPQSILSRMQPCWMITVDVPSVWPLSLALHADDQLSVPCPDIARHSIRNHTLQIELSDRECTVLNFVVGTENYWLMCIGYSSVCVQPLNMCADVWQAIA